MNGRDYMGLVKSIPCVLCSLLGQKQQGPTYAHHIREGQGTAMRASDFLTVALCWKCHQSEIGIHGNKSLLKVAKTTELELLALTVQKVHRL